jgi:hypothetical protein
MLIATRTLTLRADGGDVDVPVNIFAPQDKGDHWSCRFEIGWPEEICAREAAGIDAVQALVVALNMIAAHVYTSEHHEAGRLMWHEPGTGYGFPVTSSMRDWLVGDDAKFL